MEDRMSVISRRWLLGAVIVAAAIVAVMPAGATDVTTEWATIQLPPPPALKAVAVEPKTTALLLLDFMWRAPALRGSGADAEGAARQGARRRHVDRLHAPWRRQDHRSGYRAA